MCNARLLFVGCGPFRPALQPLEIVKYEYFSQYFSGDIITHVNHQRHMALQSIGRFGYHPFLATGNAATRNIKSIYTYIRKAVDLHRRNGKYDVVVAPNPLLTGMVSLVIGKMIGARVIIEVNGNFESAFRYGMKGKTDTSRVERLKEMFSGVTIPFVLKRADRVKLLSDNQLDAFHLSLDKSKISTFSDFVPVQKFMESPRGDGKYVLLVGYPWYLKGVDILIRAFNMISDEFPEHGLKVVGWCPEGRDYYERLAQGNKRVELCDPVYYHDIIPIMANCSLYVLASRTEAMGRVLIEAMACRKPIIASNVGGVYSIIKDGYNGLFFENENVHDLAEKMRRLLSSPDDADRLAENGYQYVQENLTEDCYLNNYRNAICQALGTGS